MKRVPASLALLALRQSGIHIKPSTLTTWTNRGHITHTADGYDLAEITAYLDTRQHQDRPCLRAGQTG